MHAPVATIAGPHLAGRVSHSCVPKSFARLSNTKGHGVQHSVPWAGTKDTAQVGSAPALPAPGVGKGTFLCSAHP